MLLLLELEVNRFPIFSQKYISITYCNVENMKCGFQFEILVWMYNNKTFHMLSETQLPEIIQSQSVAKIEVPAEAANSVVGFENTLITVNEGMFFFSNAFRSKNIQLDLPLINIINTIRTFPFIFGRIANS